MKQHIYCPFFFIVLFFLSQCFLNAQDPLLITTPISCGELVDKITILEIKSEIITDQEKLHNIHNELTLLAETYDHIIAPPQLEHLKQDLKKINRLLWDIEDAVRHKEYLQSFDHEFVELARNVYITNDKRAQIKRAINCLLGSYLIEEKSYTDYLCCGA